MIPRRRLVAALAVASAAILAAAPTRAQQSNVERQFEGKPRNEHLVGHEEAELLRRIQQVINDHDPRKLRDPYVEIVVKPEHDPEDRLPRRALRRQDLAQFIADPDAAVALGKALFWEMQAGSDFRRLDDEKTYAGTACASCHYRFGADARDTNTLRVPYVAWNEYELDKNHKQLGFGEKQQTVDAAANAGRQIRDAQELLEHRVRKMERPARRHAGEAVAEDEGEDEGEEEDDENDHRPRTPLSLIVGSQGVEPRVFQGLVVGNGLPRTKFYEADDPWTSEASALRDPTGFSRTPEWAMFLEDPKSASTRGFRQVTNRNSPSIFNAGFSDRLFHDARAESTFNGFSIFGDFDKREVIHVRRVDEQNRPLPPKPVHIGIVRAALASQAVGPVVNEVEMSYRGRTFHDLAAKLLDAPVLGYQNVAEDDSYLGAYLTDAKKGKFVGADTTYRAFIQKAFRRDWWDGTDGEGKEQQVYLRLAAPGADGATPRGTLMEANFSLYWGLSVMLYESSLVSNDSPYDQMAMGRGKAVDELWDREKANLEPVFLDVVSNPAQPGAPCPPGTAPDPNAPRGAASLPSTPPMFELKSGSEVFQRGLRAFLSRGCVDCHQGPLFSEVYERDKALDVEDLKPITIGRLVKNTLLPNSRSDAISERYLEECQGVYRRIAEAIERSGASRPKSYLVLMDFVTVYERIGGDESALAEEMEYFLKAAGIEPPPSPSPEPGLDPRTDSLRKLAQEVAKLWTTFEKTFVNRLGDRRFFREKQRLALAALLAEPLLVELMPIPPNFAQFRPVPPLNGPKVRNPYAFYDLSMYNLGASLPRYDHGIGRTEFMEGRDILNRAPAALTVVSGELLKLTGVFQAFLQTKPTVIQQRGFLEAWMRGVDKDLHRRHGVGLAEDLRRRLRGTINEAGFQELALQEIHQDLTASTVRSPRLHDPRFIRIAERSVQAGAAGSAYKLQGPAVASIVESREAPVADQDFDVTRRKTRDQVYGPWELEHPADADADERAANPRDLSWHRNLANWNRSPVFHDDDPKQTDNQGYDSLDARRADAHFFSRSRALVQNEAAEGRRKPLMHDDEIAFWGAFKTPTLRNVSLTPPYMHNGRLQSLKDVVEFYDRGGDVPPNRELNPDLHPAMFRLHLTRDEKLALVFFLMCLTDDRVRYERAPFDHPSLNLVNGYQRDGDQLREKILAIGQVGASGTSSTPRTFPSDR